MTLEKLDNTARTQTKPASPALTRDAGCAVVAVARVLNHHPNCTTRYCTTCPPPPRRRYDNNSFNFRVELRPDVDVAAPPKVDQLPKELCDMWAWVRYDFAGRPPRSDDDSASEYERGVQVRACVLFSGLEGAGSARTCCCGDG